MPIVTDHPAAVGSLDTWQVNAGTKVAAVSTNDGDTSYLYGSNVSQRFTFVALPADAATIQSCIIYALVKTEPNGPPATGPFLYIFDGVVNVQVAVGFVAAYTLFSTGFGGALTPAAINAAELGIVVQAGSGTLEYCTEFYRVTSYSVAPPTAVGHVAFI